MCTNKTESKSLSQNKTDSTRTSLTSTPSDDWMKFKSIDDTLEILNRLFDNCEIKEYDTNLYSNVHYSALWKPNMNERLQNYPISDDGYCHTFIDTIMFYKTVEHLRQEVVTEYAVIIFDHVNIEMQGCHACYPTLGVAHFLKDQNGKWQIYDFQKKFIESGEYGQRGQLSIIDFGKNLFCLALKSFGGGQGEFGGSVSYYDLHNEMNEIFNYTYVYDFDGGIGSNGEGAEHSEAELIIKPIKEDYSSLELRSKKNEKGNIEVEKYKYSQELKKYVLLKN
jgi:hypothetical protein